MTTLRLTDHQIQALRTALHCAVHDALMDIRQHSTCTTNKRGQSVRVAGRGDGGRVAYWRKMINRWMALLWKLRNLDTK